MVCTSMESLESSLMHFCCRITHLPRKRGIPDTATAAMPDVGVRAPPWTRGSSREPPPTPCPGTNPGSRGHDCIENFTLQMETELWRHTVLTGCVGQVTRRGGCPKNKPYEKAAEAFRTLSRCLPGFLLFDSSSFWHAFWHIAPVSMIQY